MEECAAEYETVLVDLQNKSEEFLDLYKRANPLENARAKVPLLQVGDDFWICESLVVSEYIAETHPGSSLLPNRPEDRAIMRLFYELCASTFSSYFPILRADDKKSALTTFQEGLVNANSFLAHHQQNCGPFLFGSQFSLAECNLAPFVQRCCTILPALTGAAGDSVVDPLEICDQLKLSHLKSWIEAVLEHPSVVTTGVPKNDMIESTTRMLERFAAMANPKQE